METLFRLSFLVEPICQTILLQTLSRGDTPQGTVFSGTFSLGAKPTIATRFRQGQRQDEAQRHLSWEVQPVFGEHLLPAGAPYEACSEQALCAKKKLEAGPRASRPSSQPSVQKKSDGETRWAACNMEHIAKRTWDTGGASWKWIFSVPILEETRKVNIHHTCCVVLLSLGARTRVL